MAIVKDNHRLQATRIEYFIITEVVNEQIPRQIFVCKLDTSESATGGANRSSSVTKAWG
jgi:hypothetical protein